MAPTKQKKVGDRREEIISAAVDLFYQYGYQKASVRDICNKVGITQAALYYHFHDKEELLYTIIEKYSNRLFFLLKSSLSEDRDPVEKLKNAITQHILSIKHSREGAKIIIEDKRFLGGDLRKLVKEKEKTVFYLYRNYIEELQDAKKIRPCNATVAAFGILGMINWLYHWYRPEKNIAFEQVAEEIVGILFRGLLSEKG
ncbi:MAG: TetR family transcriptional regulator [Deltaproteobacteria bacterium]|nr:TetR family transcriptional regulator [Deltaproteobacteria bacterium]